MTYFSAFGPETQSKTAPNNIGNGDWCNVEQDTFCHFGYNRRTNSASFILAVLWWNQLSKRRKERRLLTHIAAIPTYDNLIRRLTRRRSIKSRYIHRYLN